MNRGLEFALSLEAIALEVRAIPIQAACSDPRQALWDRDRVRVVFRSDVLSKADAQALCRATAGHLIRTSAELSQFESTREGLSALADEKHQAAALLLHAHDSATRGYEHPELMGILNVTPDSFSDGGRFNELDDAVERAQAMSREGASIIDIGGESTRPGSRPVELDEELRRVIPVIEALGARAPEITLSVDTRKAKVARAAVAAGATIVNDTSAGSFDPEMLSTVADLDCRYVAMHMQGTPRDMQRSPSYEDPVHDILSWLRERAAACVAAGIAPERLILDPGIGFGKSLEHNVALVRRAVELRSLGLPLLAGVSRKAFLGQLSGVKTPDQRIGATLAAVSLCVAGGVAILRVHDIESAAQAMAVASAHSGLLPTAIPQP